MYATTIMAAGAIALSHHAQAIVNVHRSCAPFNVQEHLDETYEMAKVAAESVKNKSPRDAGEVSSKGVYQVLFDDADRDLVQSTFDKIVALEDNEDHRITIYCNEDTIEWPGEEAEKATDTTTPFYSNAFFTPELPTVKIDLAPEMKVTLPRKTFCQNGAHAYTVNGDKESGKPDVSDQSIIYLCANALVGEEGQDMRLVSEIKKDGLKPMTEGPFTALDNIQPISATILHEFTHTTPVSGPLNDKRQPAITDGEGTDGTYGWKECADLRKKDSRAPAKVGDSYAILGLALNLQFQEKWKGFTWALGKVHLGEKDYQPFLPPKPVINRKTRSLEEMRSTSTKFESKKRAAIEKAGLRGSGWKHFFG